MKITVFADVHNTVNIENVNILPVTKNTAGAVFFISEILFPSLCILVSSTNALVRFVLLTEWEAKCLKNIL